MPLSVSVNINIRRKRCVKSPYTNRTVEKVVATQKRHQKLRLHNIRRPTFYDQLEYRLTPNG